MGGRDGEYELLATAKGSIFRFRVPGLETGS